MSTNNENKKPAPRTKKKRPKKKGGFFRILKYIILIGLITGIIASGVVFLWVSNVLADLPEIDPSNINDLLGENSVILDSNGKVLENIQNDGLRTLIEFKDISENTVNAYVSVEDKTFWDHNGFNYIRLVGAVKDSVFKNTSIKGTSTITQQLARNLYLAEIKSVRTLDRKVKEAYYAAQLEKYLTKEQIFESYLNTIYLGSGSYGVEAAAQKYFSKNASELDLVESAMIAGITALPLEYSPMRTMNKADITEEHFIIDDSSDLYTIVYNSGSEKRYKIVLLLMYKNGYITKAEYDEALATDLKTKLSVGSSAKSEISSYFSDMVKKDVIEDLMEKYEYTYTEAQNALYTNGLKIYSTIDFDMQKTLEATYSNTNFTPYFSESTANSVKNFQTKYGLQADGVIGSGTLSKMAEVGIIDPNAFSLQKYRKGIEHEDVILIKKGLDSIGLISFNDNIPKVIVRFNSKKDIITEEGTLLLFKYDNLVDSSNNFVIPSSDYKYDASGNLVLLKNNRLFFYPKKQDGQLVDIQAVIKTSYKYDENNKANKRNSDGTYSVENLYTYTGKDLLVPNEFKTFDSDNNLVVSELFLDSNPNFFRKDASGNLLVSSGDYSISTQGIIQPQSSMVIIDYRSGELKAIVGGRGVSGSMIYNRAIKPRQPGSAIKPISVYLPAIDSKQWTAASVIDDRPVYLGAGNTRWPYNWYEKYSSGIKYWGLLTLREGIEWSNNVLAATLANELGADKSIEYLKKLGITTIVESGYSNDANISAMALGGMTQGLTPIELTAAYGAVANGGVLVETTTYSSVVDNKGNIILEKNPIKEFAVDEKSAFIVQDMMRTGVTSALSKSAQIRPYNLGIPIAGKTGTTSNKLDAWFVGYSPYYVAATWFGNDLNMPLDEGSSVSDKFWGTVMSEIHTELPDKDFVRPDGIVVVAIDTKSGLLPSALSSLDPRGSTVKNEYFISGTQPTEVDDVHVKVAVCVESGKLVNQDYCPTTLIEDKIFIKRKEPYIPSENLDSRGNPMILRDSKYDIPTELCDIHTGEVIDIGTFIPGSTTDGTNPGTTTGSTTEVENPVYGLAFIIDLPTGDSRVEIPFYVDHANGSKVLLPRGTLFMTDGSVSMPDGTVLMPYELSPYPDLSALKGSTD
ncbi:MAG: transglycosylase domain-containing protein [Acidaminobacteraceae bacterium]